MIGGVLASCLSSASEAREVIKKRRNSAGICPYNDFMGEANVAEVDT